MGDARILNNCIGRHVRSWHEPVWPTLGRDPPAWNAGLDCREPDGSCSFNVYRRRNTKGKKIEESN